MPAREDASRAQRCPRDPDEVRKLADRSNVAATDIGATIADLTARLDRVLEDDSGFDRTDPADLPADKAAAINARFKTGDRVEIRCDFANGQNTLTRISKHH